MIRRCSLRGRKLLIFSAISLASSFSGSSDMNSLCRRISVQLPQELIDHIIDHLHRDVGTLKQCSLVCKAWVPSSTLHIFFYLSLAYTLRYFATRNQEKAPRPYLLKYIYDAVQLLRSPRKIWRVVRHLRIDFSAFYYDPQLHQSAEPYIRGLLQHLPRLCALECSGLHFPIGPRIDDSESSQTPRLLSLGALTLYPRTVEIQDFLDLFSDIDTLTVCGQTMSPQVSFSPDPSLLTSRSHAIRIRAIQFHFCNSPVLNHGFLSVLQNRIDLQALTTLDMRGGRLPSNLHDFLCSTPELRHFSYQVDALHTLSIPDSSNLHSLRVHVRLEARPYGRGVYRCEPWDYMLRDLTRLGDVHVEELCIALEVWENMKEPFRHLERCLKTRDWSPIDSVVRRLQPGLKRLRLELCLDYINTDERRPVTLRDDESRSRDILLRIAKERLTEQSQSILDVYVEDIPVL